MKKQVINIVDVTLRDGEQSPGKSFKPAQKLNVVQYLLTQLGVRRVEVTSARASDGEYKMLAMVMDWATQHGFAECIEVLGFADHRKSVDWIVNAGGKVMNLLCKGSEVHCQATFDKDVQGHLVDIVRTVEYAKTYGLTVNVYLETWSQGMSDSPEYVRTLLDGLAQLPINRVMLCDTLGVLNPVDTEKFVLQVHAWQPGLKYDIHCHDDYGLAVANSLAAVKTGKVTAVHVTVNGLGERAGNTKQAALVACINDHTDYRVDVDESKLRQVSELVSVMSGRRVPENEPVCGNVFVNTAGIHADGDLKGKARTGRELYRHPKLNPERFGSNLSHALGKLSGKASIINNAEKLGFNLSEEEVALVLAKVQEIGDEGREVTIADLLYIIADVLSRPEVVVFEVLYADVHSKLHRRGTAAATIRFRREDFEISYHGDGGFDAFMNAVRAWAQGRKVFIPTLLDFDPIIPPGGSTNALVQARVKWQGQNGEGSFWTNGLDPDQAIASIKAAAAAINVCNQKKPK